MKKLLPSEKKSVAVRNAEAELVQKNALATFYGAGGHTKAANNRAAAERWKAEAEALGFELPEEMAAAHAGTFNGPGAV